jgi:phosphoribosyl 1,2-cyclic phosphodiesterase
MPHKKTALTFWGTRGSIPSPGKDKSKYGGNTSCIELQFPNDQLIILDGGTGIRELGNTLVMRNKQVRASILLSHYHWDHIQGLPFFAPAYNANNALTIYGANHPQFPLGNVLSSQMESIHFPVKASSLAAHISFKELSAEVNCFEDVEVRILRANHPGTTFSYSFSFDNHKLVYMTDNELLPNTAQAKSHIDYTRDNFIRFIHGADTLIHDAQYSDREYEIKKGWGHSHWREALTLAAEGEVKQLILFHHDPDHNDTLIDTLVKEGTALLKEMSSSTRCSAAMEGTTLHL